MVVHDQENRERWTAERMAREQEKQKPPKQRFGRWSVLAVQSLACGLVVALTLLLRVAGGTAYEELRQGFQDALMKNELMSVLSRLWDGEVAFDGDESDVKETDFTSEKAARLMGISCITVPVNGDA